MKINELHDPPSPEAQARVYQGSEAQQKIEHYLDTNFSDRYALVSIAPPSSKRPDLVANIDEQPLQFEIKSRANKNAFIKFYERSLGRGDADKVFDAFARIYSDNTVNTFSELIDVLRLEKGSTGFPGDTGVAKSGSIWINVKNRSHLSKMRSYVINLLRSEQNDYFAIFDKSTHEISLFDTGKGTNPLNLPRIPNFQQINIDTYGGQYKGKMRVALKVKLAR